MNVADGAHSAVLPRQDFRFPSFPRKREFSKPLKKLDTRFHEHGKFKGLAKVLNISHSFSGRVSARNSAPFSRLTSTGIGRPVGNAFTRSVNWSTLLIS